MKPIVENLQNWPKQSSIGIYLTKIQTSRLNCIFHTRKLYAYEMRLFLVNTLHCISGQNRTDTIQVENTSSGLNHEVNIFFQHKIVVSLNYRCVSRICKNLGVLDRRGGLQSSSKSHFTLTGAFTCSALCSAAYFSGDSQWEQIAKIRQKFQKIPKID